MKKIHSSILIAFILISTLIACKKTNAPAPVSPVLKSFSFPTNTDLKIDLSWAINGQPYGYNEIDLDLIIDDGATSPSYSHDYSAKNSGMFESITIGKNDANNLFNVGFIFYWRNNMFAPAPPNTVEYTIKVYPVGNISAAQTFIGNFVYPTVQPDANIIYYQLEFAKGNTLYKFDELVTKITFDQSQFVP